jgi:hypothetical protein
MSMVMPGRNSEDPEHNAPSSSSSSSLPSQKKQCCGCAPPFSAQKQQQQQQLIKDMTNATTAASFSSHETLINMNHTTELDHGPEDDDNQLLYHIAHESQPLLPKHKRLRQLDADASAANVHCCMRPSRCCCGLRRWQWMLLSTLVGLAVLLPLLYWVIIPASLRFVIATSPGMLFLKNVDYCVWILISEIMTPMIH